jgi:predicted O-methyltransferase YrrM
MNFVAEYLQRCSEWSDIVDHLPRLFDETCRYEAPQVVELGVRSGNSTCAFLAAVETVGGHVWSVDPERAHVPPHWFDSDLWTFVQADDLMVVDEAPVCDVLFIDTTHAYHQTFAELLHYVPKVRDGGVILLHDTELERPEAAPRDDPFPVRRAIEDYLEWVGMGVSVDGIGMAEFVPGCNGLAVLRRVVPPDGE